MDYQQVYASGAARYQELVAGEDCDDNLLAVLENRLTGVSSIVEFGAGTGRVTRLLGQLGLSVIATEPSSNMLGEAVRLAEPGAQCGFVRAEAAAAPLRSGSVDAAIAGWVFGHQVEWRPEDWNDTITAFLGECERVTSHGLIIVIETLGTGHETPHAPSGLAQYYNWLEAEMDFERSWIRTDYEFASAESAAAITGDFFGQAFADLARKRQWSRIPECTGVWVRPPPGTER